MSKNKKNKNIKNYNKTNNREKELEKTMKIRIDKERIEDIDSLDTSFLEGRNPSKNKEKILREQNKIINNLSILKYLFFIIAFICFIILIIILISNFNSYTSVDLEEEPQFVEVSDEKVIDDNYLFVGDSYTKELDFSELDYHYVKNYDEELTTSKLLEDMNDKIYKYNPSKVFIQVGNNDLDNGVEKDEIINNISKIIDEITDNRPYAEIYIESLYPIGENDAITSINTSIKKLCSTKKVNYIDMYDLLSNYIVDNNISNEGYNIILNELKEKVGN
jgi:hypothetical protein